MADYITIIFAVIFFTAQFAFTKIYESSIKQTKLTTYVMLIITGLVGAILYLIIGGFKIQFSLVSVFWAVLFAFIMIPYYVIGIKVLSLGSVAIYSMFMMLGGMAVPFLYGIIFLKETVTIGKILGSFLLSFFIFLQAMKGSTKAPDKETDKAPDKKQKVLFFSLCLLIFFINGMTGVIAKAHQITDGSVDEISFTVISCLFIVILSIILMLPELFTLKKSEALSCIKETTKVKPLLSMILIGVATYTGNFLHLLAAATVPASVQFPLVSGGVIVLSALVSTLLFKEKLSKVELISIAGAFVSTFLFAF